jgi:hypothetical protein
LLVDQLGDRPQTPPRCHSGKPGAADGQAADHLLRDADILTEDAHVLDGELRISQSVDDALRG